MITYNDISNHNPGFKITADMPLVVAKVTQGVSYFDPYYLGFKEECRQKSVNFAAYHWLSAGPSGQARFAYMHAVNVPLMLDVEDHGMTSVTDVVRFIKEYRGMGGKCNVVYLPRWYWAQMGSPSLQPLVDLGMALVASNYTSVADGWKSYGGMQPAILQFTDHIYDTNTFNGTRDQLWQLFNGGVVTSPSLAGGYDDYLPDTVMAMLTGQTPRFGFPDATGPTWDNDALDNHNLKAVEGRLTALITAGAQAQVQIDYVKLAQAIIDALKGK